MNIYRHKKRGSLYVMVGRAGMQISAETLHPFGWNNVSQVAEQLEKRAFVVYRALADDTLWVRPESEFMDGRFVVVGQYYLERSGAGPKKYYKSGEGRGWKDTIEEATLYSDDDFATRDRNSLFPYSERQRICVRSLREYES